MSVNQWYGPSRATMLAREFDKNHPGEILPAEEDHAPNCNSVLFNGPMGECDCKDRMQRALSQSHAILFCGWRIVLRAEQHVMKDLGWDWKTRFDVSGFLWRHALQLCKDRILGENK